MSKTTLLAPAWRTLLLYGITAFQVAAGAILSVVPSSQTVRVGDDFLVSVNAEELTDLYAFQFDVSFDPLVLEATGVFEGDLLGTAGATFFIPGDVDNSLGLISFTTGSLVGPVSGANGSGSLVQLAFHTLADGVSPIVVIDPILLDSSLVDIAFTSSTGSVQVVSEPGTAALSGILGLLALCTVARRHTAGHRGSTCRRRQVAAGITATCLNTVPKQSRPSLNT